LTARREWTENGEGHSVRRQYRVPWGEVQSIEEFDWHAFILTRASCAFIIPQAAFPTIAAFQAFAALASQYWTAGAATAITAAIPPESSQSAVAAKPVR
jgi:hypothetical protein